MKEIDRSFILKDLKLLKGNKSEKSVYKLTLFNKDVRLDIFQFQYTWYLIHNFAYENKINVAREIFITEEYGIVYRICDFINGSFIDKADDVKDAYIKSGEQIAKLNSVKPSEELMNKVGLKGGDINDYGLTNSDFSSPNAIYDKNKNVYLIDTDSFKVKKISNGELDFTLVKPLVKWIKNREKINYFLEGYSKYRDPTNIIKLCESFNWQWII